MLEEQDRKEGLEEGPLRRWAGREEALEGGVSWPLTSTAHPFAFRKHCGNRAVPAPWYDGGDPEEVLSLPVLGRLH